MHITSSFKGQRDIKAGFVVGALLELSNGMKYYIEHNFKWMLVLQVFYIYDYALQGVPSELANLLDTVRLAVPAFHIYSHCGRCQVSGLAAAQLPFCSHSKE